MTVHIDHPLERSSFRPSLNRSSTSGRLAVLGGALAPMWRRSWFGIGIAAAVTGTWAVVAGRWTPRGPLTSREALWSIVLSVAVGATCGLVTRSRWIMLASPALFVVVFEAVRAHVDGPTVDGLHFSTYGIMAFVVGRGFHALVSWLPMMLGAASGAGLARLFTASVQPRQPTLQRDLPKMAKRFACILATMGLVGFSVAIARPASTKGIRDAQGNRVPGSVAELTRVEINGNKLGLMIRGHSVQNPVLLFLAGGPGGSELGAMRNHLKELEKYFTVVTWDQRGTGKSYDSLDNKPAMTLTGVVDDTIAVTQYLRKRFGQDRIYLAGQSWGSTLGVLAVDRQPGLYRAFIGVGQMVSQLATDRIFYDDTLKWARQRGDKTLIDRLTKIGRPPYERMLSYETALSYEHEMYLYDHSVNSEGEGGFSENFLVPEYTLVDQVHLLGAFMDTFGALYPQLQDVDFREQVRSLNVPVFFVQGAHEAPGRALVFDEWYAGLRAPSKDRTSFATSGHRPLFEQPKEFVSYMVDVVLARTQTKP
jgi:proline iminopeptidase